MTALRTAFAAALLAFAAVANAADTEDLLETDQAFQPSARLVTHPATGAAGIEVEYRIADGYYLYRDRMRFEVIPRGLPVAAPEFPPAAEMDDPFIGKTWIYRKGVVVLLPFTANVSEPEKYRLRITAQGCAQDRFCYSPFRQEVALGAPARRP